MKRSIVLFMVMGFALNVSADRYYSPRDVEIPLPEFRTESQFKKWQTARRNFIISSLLVGAASAYCMKKSSTYRKRASGIVTQDMSVLVPDPTFGNVYPTIQSEIERRRVFSDRSSNYRKIGDVLAALSAAGLLISFSLRF